MTMDMKKINIGAFVIAGAMLMTASGCTDSDFDSKYEDPSTRLPSATSWWEFSRK